VTDVRAHWSGLSVCLWVPMSPPISTSLWPPASLQALLTPTVIYVKKVVELHEKVGLKGVVHITGGGMTENIPRVIPDGHGVNIKVNSYEVGGVGWGGQHWHCTRHDSRMRSRGFP
jgi:hypothetical protein